MYIDLYFAAKAVEHSSWTQYNIAKESAPWDQCRVHKYTQHKLNTGNGKLN